MPTTHPRVVVTETDELSRALDDAARRWPGESRAGLLVRLALEGHHVRQRRTAIERWSGAFSDGYDPDLIAGLRDDWP